MSVGWSGLEALSKNHFILQPCSFLSGNDTVFFSQRVFLPNDTSHRIRLQSQSVGTNLHSPIPRWPGGRRGAGSLGLDCILSRRNIHTPVDITRGELLFLGGCREFSAQLNLSPTDPLPVLSVGIYGVGKAALHPPALAVLSHTPEGATQTIAWVGKGIVYDTGGLSIKGKVRCCGQCLGGSLGWGGLLGASSALRRRQQARFLGPWHWGVPLGSQVQDESVGTVSCPH